MVKKITEIELYMVVIILVGVWRIYFWITEFCGGSKWIWDKPYDSTDKEEQRQSFFMQ